MSELLNAAKEISHRPETNAAFAKTATGGLRDCEHSKAGPVPHFFFHTALQEKRGYC